MVRTRPRPVLLLPSPSSPSLTHTHTGAHSAPLIYPVLLCLLEKGDSVFLGVPSITHMALEGGVFEFMFSVSVFPYAFLSCSFMPAFLLFMLPLPSLLASYVQSCWGFRHIPIHSLPLSFGCYIYLCAHLHLAGATSLYYPSLARGICYAAKS